MMRFSPTIDKYPFSVDASITSGLCHFILQFFRRIGTEIIIVVNSQILKHYYRQCNDLDKHIDIHFHRQCLPLAMRHFFNRENKFDQLAYPFTHHHLQIRFKRVQLMHKRELFFVYYFNIDFQLIVTLFVLLDVQFFLTIKVY